MTADAALTPFEMLGDPAAEACAGDACVIPAPSSPAASV